MWSTSEQTPQHWKAKSLAPRLTVVSQANRYEFVLTYSWKSGCKSSPIRFSHFSKAPATRKSRHAIARIKTQPIRPLCDSWILVFSKLLRPQATCSTVRETGNSSSTGIGSWCCSLFTFPHLCAPEIPDIRPATSPQVLFSFCHSCALPGLLHHTCFLTLVLLHQKPWDGGGSRMTNTSTLCCNTNRGGGRCYARVGGGISSGQSINCVALPAHSTFVSAFCWNTCKLVIAEVFLAAKP